MNSRHNGYCSLKLLFPRICSFFLISQGQDVHHDEQCLDDIVAAAVEHDLHDSRVQMMLLKRICHENENLGQCRVRLHNTFSTWDPGSRWSREACCQCRPNLKCLWVYLWISGSLPQGLTRGATQVVHLWAATSVVRTTQAITWASPYIELSFLVWMGAGPEGSDSRAKTIRADFAKACATPRPCPERVSALFFFWPTKRCCLEIEKELELQCHVFCHGRKPLSRLDRFSYSWEPILSRGPLFIAGKLVLSA